MQKRRNLQGLGAQSSSMNSSQADDRLRDPTKAYSNVPLLAAAACSAVPSTLRASTGTVMASLLGIPPSLPIRPDCRDECLSHLP